MPETVARGDFGNGRRIRIGLAEVTPRELHTARQKEMLGAGSQLQQTRNVRSATPMVLQISGM
jgi:hypothetical protein